MRQVSLIVVCSAYIILLAAIFVQCGTLERRPRDMSSGFESGIDEDDDLNDFLERLGHKLVQSYNYDSMRNNKRTVDLGFSRGYSGGQAAKHLMGLAAANYAGGPGRKRRSILNTQE